MDNAKGSSLSFSKAQITRTVTRPIAPGCVRTTPRILRFPFPIPFSPKGRADSRFGHRPFLGRVSDFTGLVLVLGANKKQRLVALLGLELKNYIFEATSKEPPCIA